MEMEQVTGQLLQMVPVAGRRNVQKGIELMLMDPDSHLTHEFERRWQIDFAVLPDDQRDAVRGGFVSRLEEILADLILQDST